MIWELNFKVQTSFEAQNFLLLLSLSLHSFSLTFKLLSMASYGGELLLDSSSSWSGISSQFFFFSIWLPLKFKKQRTPLMKKIQGLQVPHGATSISIGLNVLPFIFRKTQCPLSFFHRTQCPLSFFIGLNVLCLYVAIGLNVLCLYVSIGLNVLAFIFIGLNVFCLYF